MPTRLQRSRNNEPLGEIDLDPWQSNSNRRRSANPIPSEAPVARTGSSIPPGTTVSSLTPIPSVTTPEQNTSTMTEENGIQPSTPTHTRFHSTPASPAHSVAHSSISQPKRAEDYSIQKFAKGDKLNHTGSNFFAWKGIQEMILRYHQWFDTVNGRTSPPDPDDDPETLLLWDKLDNLAKTQLALNMDFSLYGELQSEIGSAADLWKLLNERFGQRNVNSRTAASSRLHAKRLGDTETFKEHITELRKLRSNLTESGGKITSEEWHSIILKSISEHSQWRSMVLYGSVIKEPEQLIMTLELQEDNGFINIYKPKEHTALSTTTQSEKRGTTENGKAPTCTNCTKRGHTIEQCYAPGGGATDQRPTTFRTPNIVLERENQKLRDELNQLRAKQSASITSAPGSTYETANSAYIPSQKHFVL